MSEMLQIQHHRLPDAAGKLISYCYWLERVTIGQPAENLLNYANRFIDHAVHHQPVNAYCVWQAVRHIQSNTETLSGFEPKCLAIGDNQAISLYLIDRAKEQINSLIRKDWRKWKLAADTLTCNRVDIAALGWLEVSFRVVNAELNAMMNRSPDAKQFRHNTYSQVANVRYTIEVNPNSQNQIDIFESYSLPKLEAVDCLRPVADLHGRSIIPLSQRDPGNPADWILSIGWLGNPVVRECLDTLSHLNPQEYCRFF